MKTVVPFTPETARAFWQGVYDELGIEVMVPLAPELTDKQVKSIATFGFLPLYLPAIGEERYPACFVKPNWGQYLTIASIERLPLVGKWVAVETIAKPNYDDPKGYADDLLMVAVKRFKRFKTSHVALTNWLLAKIATTIGFSKKRTRLPTAEERNFIGNLFNWLRERRQMNLPDLGSARSWEWCANAYGPGYRLIAGHYDYGGLADVYHDWHGFRYVRIAFRVLVDL